MALHIAAEQGHVAMVEFILEQEEDINIDAQDSAGNTALHLAALNTSKSKSTTMIKRLEEAGANALIKNKAGKTAAEQKVGRFGFGTNPMKAREKEKRKAKETRLSRFEDAIEEDDFNKVLDIMKEDKKDTQTSPKKALKLSAKLGSYETFKYFAKQVIKEEENGEGVVKKHISICADKNGESFLHTMLRDKKMAEVFWLLAHGADVNAYNMRPKAPYTRDHRYGWTPLMLAAAWGNTAVVKKLLELKANINAQSNQEETSKYFFINSGNVSCPSNAFCTEAAFLNNLEIESPFFFRMLPPLI